MKKNHTVIASSFPRSGNIYLTSKLNLVLYLHTAVSIHLPEIFEIKNVPLVSIFRKPEDAISSFIYQTTKNENSTKEDIIDHAEYMIIQYKEYIKNAKKYNQNVCIIKFDKLISNTLPHCIKIGERFNLTIRDNYEFSFKSMNFLEDVWTDTYDGHLPREKTAQRIFIDHIVKSLDAIQDLNKEYEDFITEYETFKTL